MIKKHSKMFSDRLLTGKVISSLIEELINRYTPTYVSSEDAFYNPARPNAFVSLLIAIYAIESKLYQLYSDDKLPFGKNIKLYKTPPTLVKKIFSMNSGGGKSTKDDMYHNLQDRVNEHDISFVGRDDCPSLEEFTEHSVDAIAVGYAFYKFWIPLLNANVLEKKCTSLSRHMKDRLKKLKYKSPYL